MSENKEIHKDLFDEFNFEAAIMPMKVALHIENGKDITKKMGLLLK